MSANGGEYVTHNCGAMRLLQLRGAGAHMKGSGHLLFLAFRLHGVRDTSFYVKQIPHYG
jgi:hypothetical protein